MRRVIFALLTLLLSASKSEAQQTSVRSVFLEGRIKLDFEPIEAQFVVRFDANETARVPGIFLGSFRELDNEDEKEWWIGAKVKVPTGTKRMESFVILRGSDDRNALIPPEIYDVLADKGGRSSVDHLRSHLLDRKKVQSSWRMQLAEEEASLRRLRSDAEVIGNFGRIIDAREELDRVTEDIKNISDDISGIEHFLKLASSYPAPRNYLFRQQELTSQLGELAEAAKKAERSESSRRNQSEGEVRRRMAVLESTRGKSEAALEQQLRAIRAQRMRLERELRAVDAVNAEEQ